MIAKIFAVFCLLGLTRAGHLYGGYGGYAAVAPAYSSYVHAPAVSHVSQYSIHSAPLVKSYAPLVKTYAPLVKSYAPVSYAYASPYVGHSYAAAPLAHGYGSYGSYGYGGYGHKYGW